MKNISLIGPIAAICKNTQYPQVQNLGKNPTLKRNLGIRLCGRVDSAASAANILGIKNSGAESLQGYGDFLLKMNGQLSRVTIAHLTEDHTIHLPHRPEPERIPDLPTIEMNGPKSAGKMPEPVDPEQVALALFEPAGINRTAKQIGIGSTKAKRVIDFANEIRTWARAHGHQQLILEGE